MQRYALEARVDLTYGYLATDLVRHRIEALTIDSASPILLYTAKNLVDTSGFICNFTQFKGGSPEYLAIQNNATVDNVLFKWSSGIATCVTTVPAGGIAIIPNPLEDSGVIAIWSSTTTALIELSIWGYPL